MFVIFFLQLSRNYATAPAKEQKVKVPVTMCGVSENYASALYIAAVKASALEKVESEILDLIEVSKKSSKFCHFMKDLSVPTDTRVKAISNICAQAKFGDLTRNFLVVLAENGRLKHIDAIAKKVCRVNHGTQGGA
ncbi:ATP synthase subunit O, mitochondrial-like [Nicotiana tabacum]|uniref:ATP synthase subunit O, mitochondrial-like n=2 Tax=Nicotiana tabacum TaxID=4097 RepID=A0AC58TUK8_TOBAC